MTRFKPSYPGEFPSLGWAALDWLDYYIPDLPLDEEMQRFVVDLLRIDPVTGDRWYNHAMLCRAKGRGKSPLQAKLAILWAFGPTQFGGWDHDGQPIAAPYEMQLDEEIQLAALSLDQTRNTWSMLYKFLEYSPRLAEDYKFDLGRTRVILPQGYIVPVTASAGTREGQRVPMALMDETGYWSKSNGGLALADTLGRNTIKLDGISIETTNAWVPGEGTVAERTYGAWQAGNEGKLREEAGRILVDYLQAPLDTDISDPESLKKGLKVAYGKATWINLDRVVSEIYDPRNPVEKSRRFFLNQSTAPEDAWVSPQEWGRCAAPTKELKPGDVITLGFDGSIRDDSTALVGCRVEDGHLFLAGIWEKPDGPAGDNWQVDRQDVDAILNQTFNRYNVQGFYADPAHFQDEVSRWTAEYGEKLVTRATERSPIEWWTHRQSAVVAALERMHTAILGKELTHDGNHVLERHITNARRRNCRAGITISKEFPSSPRKIDASIAAALAYEARGDLLAKGVKKKKSRRVHAY